MAIENKILKLLLAVIKINLITKTGSHGPQPVLICALLAAHLTYNIT